MFAVDGVANCQLVSPAADLPLSNVTLPVLGALTIENGAAPLPENSQEAEAAGGTAQSGGDGG